MTTRIAHYLKKFEQYTIILLSVGIALAILLSFFDVLWTVSLEILNPPFLLIPSNELLELLGSFLIILVGLELLETIRHYLEEGHIKPEILLVVALIAVSRKVIILDVKHSDPLMIMGVAVLIIALTLSYYLFKKIQN